MAAFRVAKWGNSLAVRLPAELVRELSRCAGDEIDVPTGLIRKALPKMTRDEAAAAIAAIPRWQLPEGYKFDREEANAR